MCIYYYLAVLESWTRTTKEKNSWANTKPPACILQFFFKTDHNKTYKKSSINNPCSIFFPKVRVPAFAIVLGWIVLNK